MALDYAKRLLLNQATRQALVHPVTVKLVPFM